MVKDDKDCSTFNARCQLTRFIYQHTLCRTMIDLFVHSFIHSFIYSFIPFVGKIIVSFGQQPRRGQWSMISQGNLFGSCRTQGEFPVVRSSVRPPVPPCWPSRPQIRPPSPQFSHPALQALNQPSEAQICPPNLKPAPGLILPSNLQICLQWPKSVI